MTFAIKLFRLYNVAMLTIVAVLSIIFGAILSIFTGSWGFIEFSGQVVARSAALIDGRPGWNAYYSIGEFLSQTSNAPFFVAFARSDNIFSGIVRALPHEGYALLMLIFGISVMRLMWLFLKWLTVQVKREATRLKY